MTWRTRRGSSGSASTPCRFPASQRCRARQRRAPQRTTPQGNKARRRKRSGQTERRITGGRAQFLGRPQAPGDRPAPRQGRRVRDERRRRLRLQPAFAARHQRQGQAHPPASPNAKAAALRIPQRRGQHSRHRLRARNLQLEGKLLGEGVTAYNHSIGDLNVKISGHADNDKAVVKSENSSCSRASGRSTRNTPGKDKAVTANLHVADLDLKEVGDLLVPFNPNDTRPVRRRSKTSTCSPAGSRATGSSSARADKDRVRVGRHVKIQGAGAPGFVADAIDARTVLENGTFTLGPIRAPARHHSDGGRQGSPTGGQGGRVVFRRPRRATQITASLNLANWPLEAGADGWVDISGGSEKLVIDLASEPDAKQRFLPGKSAAGSINFASGLTYKGQTLGKTQILGDFLGTDGSTSQVRHPDAGRQRHRQRHHRAGKATRGPRLFHLGKGELAAAGRAVPCAAGPGGRLHWAARVQPSVEPRSLGPLAFSLELVPEGGRFKAVRIRKDRHPRLRRLQPRRVNDPADIASTMEVAGGLLRLWGRVSYHDLKTTKDAISSQVLIDFKALDLNQIVHAAHPSARVRRASSTARSRSSARLRARGPSRSRPGEEPPPFIEKLATAIVAHGPVKLPAKPGGAAGLQPALRHHEPRPGREAEQRRRQRRGGWRTATCS